MTLPRALITSGEPAGIGPDIVIQAAQMNWPAELVVMGDPHLLLSRAKQLQLPLILENFNEKLSPSQHQRSTLKIIPLTLKNTCEAGKLNINNAGYVMEMLEKAAEYAMRYQCPLVTAPVHKGILNDAGFSFQGHTEFFATLAGVSSVVMLFVVKRHLQKNLNVALLTTHLPLSQVSRAITPERLITTLRILHSALTLQFGISHPAIVVCGLNPHAGEGGHLGHEEIDIIIPTLNMLRSEGMNIVGPLSADTIFTEKYLKQADAVLAMYHDQALPVVKYMSFGHAVNVTVGLPFIRTSVDHGTALDVAGTGGACVDSLKAAITLAIKV